MCGNKLGTSKDWRKFLSIACITWWCQAVFYLVPLSYPTVSWVEGVKRLRNEGKTRTEGGAREKTEEGLGLEIFWKLNMKPFFLADFYGKMKTTTTQRILK